MSARDERPDEPLVKTEYGWAAQSEKPPYNLALFWMKMPESHIYFHDGDGWHRIKPPEKQFLPDGDLPHG